MPSLSRRSRHLIFRNEPVKWNGAGSRPRRRTEIAPARLEEIELAIEADAVRDPHAAGRNPAG